MKIVIDGIVFTQKKLEQWKRKRAIKVLKKFKAKVDLSGSTEYLCQNLANIKLKLSCDEMRDFLKKNLYISTRFMRLASVLSGGKRRNALTTIYVADLKAEVFSKEINDLMLNATVENRTVNVSVCPDHYLLHPQNGTLEVIETAGNSPLPTQFFITFDDEAGINEPRDLSYTHQSVGIAKLKDGTVIGGVRHQFKNTPTGMEARLLVEFPCICPKMLIREHQKHLAAEWSGWMEHIKALCYKPL